MTAKENNQFLKDCIHEALMDLLDEKPFAQISITEIARRAGVSRMTYYRNYTSKEDIIQNRMNELVASYYEKAAAHKNADGHISYQNVLQCFLYFYQYQDDIRHYIHAGFGNIVEDAITNYILMFLSKTGRGTSDKYILHAYSGAIYNVYKYWLVNRTQESPETLAKLIYDIFQAWI